MFVIKFALQMEILHSVIGYNAVHSENLPEALLEIQPNGFLIEIPI